MTRHGLMLCGGAHRRHHFGQQSNCRRCGAAKPKVKATPLDPAPMHRNKRRALRRREAQTSAAPPPRPATYRGPLITFGLLGGGALRVPMTQAVELVDRGWHPLPKRRWRAAARHAGKGA